MTVNIITKVVSAFFVLTAALAVPLAAQAANGNVYATSCACTTTSQFKNAAAVAAGHYQANGNGTYVVVSTSAPMTAYMKVVMTATQVNGTTFWIAQSETPINASGASLSGLSEAQLESNFGTIDAGFFGSRSNPEIVSEPSNYAGSFINSLDEEVGPGIDQALVGTGVAWSTLPVGFVITVKFSDGTTASFIKTNNSTDHWAWFGVAHNAAGKPINRNGTLISNPNTSGTGAGNVNGNYNFGNVNPSFDISLTPSSFCGGSVTVGDEGIGIVTTVFFAPC